MQQKRKRTIEVPHQYYSIVHERRYKAILGSGAVFCQKAMQPAIARAWDDFIAVTGLRPCSTGLEIGAGTGINAIHIARQGYHVFGMDISPTAIRKAQQLTSDHSVQAIFLVGDMFYPAVRPASLDFIANIWTLHVVGEQCLRDRHLAECYGLLKNGGLLFLNNEASEHDVLNADEDLTYVESDRWNIPEHMNTYDCTDGSTVTVSFPGHMPEGMSGRRSLAEHVAEVERAGFRVLKSYEEVIPHPLPDVPGNRVMTVMAIKEVQ